MKKELLAVGMIVVLLGCGARGTGGAASPESAVGGSEAAKPEARPATPVVAERRAESVIPAGIKIKVRTGQRVSTKSAKDGDRVLATLAEPIVVNGRTIAEKGADAVLRVTDSDDGGRVKGVAHISVKLTHLEFQGGRQIDLETNTITRQAKRTRKEDATKVAVASGVGAAIGAIAGGGRGAAIGAGSGAAAGTGVVMATRGEPAEIASESLLTFELRSPAKLN